MTMLKLHWIAARPSGWKRILSALILAGVAFSPVVAQRPQTGGHWVGTWSAALVARPQPAGQSAATPAQPPPAAPQGQGRGGGRGGGLPASFNNQTLRQIVHTTVGGDQVRVVFSNVFGSAPLPIEAAEVALRDKDALLVARSAHPLTFGGRSSAIIPAGAVAVSDPVSLVVPAETDLAIDLYLPDSSAASPSPMTIHNTGLQTNYFSSGNQVGAMDMPAAMMTQAWFFIARVEVMAPQQVGAVVVLGDSITDGFRSTANANARWPDQLAKRLTAAPASAKVGILNAGITGNRLLLDGIGPSALARFDRDVLEQVGATYVIVMEGINDIGMAGRESSPTAADLIAAHVQMIERAHARGLKVYGATLTPFEGANYWTTEGEAKRQALNDWIRTSNVYDGVIDFDAVLRDPEHRTKLLAMYQAGDNLHPNDAGYALMAASIDLKIFEARPR